MTSSLEPGIGHAGSIEAGDRDILSYQGWVFSLALVWGLGDAASTYAAAAATGSTAMEANPLIRTLLALDPMLLAVFKAAVVVVVGVTLLEWRSLVECVPGHRLWFVGCVGLGLVVTANNLAIGLSALA
jgi:hypothetical protein